MLKSRRLAISISQAKTGLPKRGVCLSKAMTSPERFREMQNVVIAETGFGTGLNFLAVMAEIAALGDAAPHLHFISTEIAPLSAGMIEAALAPWPQLTPFRQLLTRLCRHAGRDGTAAFLDGRVTLDLLYGDSVSMLALPILPLIAGFLMASLRHETR